MSLTDFSCDTFELSLRLSKEDLNEEAFLRAAGVNREEFANEDGDIAFGLSFGPKNGADIHAHLRVVLFKDKPQRFDVIYHQGKSEDQDATFPYAEDVVSWLASFLTNTTQNVVIRGEYSFDKSFSPIVFLPFPLASAEKAMAGTLVTGVSLFIPKDVPETAIIQNFGDETALVFNTSKEVDLSAFELQSVLEQLTSSITLLIRRTGDSPK